MKLKIDPLTEYILKKDSNVYRHEQELPSLGQLAIGAGAAAAIIFGAKKIYQNHMSKASEKCRESPDKKYCMKLLKLGGRDAVIQHLNSQMYRCQGDMDCMRKIRRTIERFGGET
jgi:hypothetical protein